MSKFSFHSPESAPEDSRGILATLNKQYGFVPNLMSGLAEAPAALHGYMGLSEQYGKCSLSAQEQQVVLLATSVINECGFCVAAHSFVARNMAKLDDASLQALRSGEELPNPRLNALAQFTRAVVNERGWVNGKALDAFLVAGYSKAQVLEVITGVALKTLSNYANHVLETPVNDQFKAETWEGKAKMA